jgi:hypothetical protein
MGKSHSWEADGRLSGQEIALLFPRSQESITLFYYERNEASPCPHTLFLQDQTVI